MEKNNILVVGAGSGGLISAYIGAVLKAKVTLFERHKMGGDCLNTGCVPSKALIRTARFVHDMKRHQELGVKTVNYDFDFKDVMARVHEKIAKIEPHDSIERYTNLGVNCVTGDATVLDEHTVMVNDTKYWGRNIILAMGASPFIPPIKGMDLITPLTSENLWQLSELPKRLVVLGGGPIGCELTQAFQRLGSQVTQVEMLPQILPREDEDVAEFIAKKLVAEGVDLKTSAKATEIRINDTGEKTLTVSHHGNDIALPFDEIIVAVGRKPNSDSPWLQKLGLEKNPNGTLKVDPYLRTTIKSIYACGDLTGPYQFTHTASHGAWYCAVNSLFPFKKFKADYRVISWCTFTDPEIAQVGLNEAEAKKQNIPYEVTKYGVDDLDRAICESEDHGFVKILTQPGKDRILGVTVVSHLAGELIGEFVLSMKWGLGLNKIMGTIHAYPTFIEANKAAAGAWKRKHAPEGLLKLVARYHSWRRR